MGEIYFEVLFSWISDKLLGVILNCYYTQSLYVCQVCVIAAWGCLELGKAESRSIWVSDEINQIPAYFSPQKEIDFNLNCLSVLPPPSSATTATHSIHSTSFPQIFTPLKSCLFALVRSKGAWKKCLKKGVIFLTKCSPFFDIFLKLLHIFLLSNFPVVILSLQINWCINPAYLDRVLSPWNNLPALNGDFIVNCPNTMLSIIYTQYIHFKDCSTQQDMILISSHHGIILQLGCGECFQKTPIIIGFLFQIISDIWNHIRGHLLSGDFLQTT